jgi:hypothetical protein
MCWACGEEEEDYHRDTVPKGCLRQGSEVNRSRKRRRRKNRSIRWGLHGLKDYMD